MKSVKYLFFIIAFSIVALQSCKKDDTETMWEGVAKDLFSKNPMAYLQVYLMEADNDAGKNSHIVDTKICDADGKFHFMFKSSKKKFYALNFVDECFTYQTGYTTRNNRSYSSDFIIEGKSQFFIELKNVSPFDANDKITYALNKNATAGEYPAFTGASINTTASGGYFKMNQKIYVKSFVTKNSITTVKLDSITFNSCDDHTFDLSY